MCVMLAALKQFNFRYLLKFFIISSVHGAFSLSINVHAQKHWKSKIVAKNVIRKF